MKWVDLLIILILSFSLIDLGPLGLYEEIYNARDPCTSYATENTDYLILSPRLLGLVYRAPARRLRVTCGAPTTLLFDLFRNHCCRNKPTDALVSQTLLYYCRVIRGRLLLAPYPLLPFPLQPRTGLLYFS